MFYSRNGQMLSTQLYYSISLFVSIRMQGSISAQRVLINSIVASKTFLQIVCVLYEMKKENTNS